jgi:hypothetical protein
MKSAFNARKPALLRASIANMIKSPCRASIPSFFTTFSTSVYAGPACNQIKRAGKSNPKSLFNFQNPVKMRLQAVSFQCPIRPLIESPILQVSAYRGAVIRSP